MSSDLRGMELHGDRGIELVRGRGVHLYDSDGVEYLDMMSNYGVNILGHADPEVTAALAAQAATLGSAHQSFRNAVRDRFIGALGALLPPELSRVCCANSGAESVEGAIKFARVASGRHGVIAMRRGYHGRTMGALSVTADRRYRDPFLPMLDGVVHVSFDDLAAVEEALASASGPAVGAIVVEPIQGEAGIRVPAAGYLRGMRDLATRHGVVLIFDEVQTAFRTGHVFAFEHENVVPDILCLSKGIANGLPLGVTVTTEAIASAVPRGSHGSTFAGNPLACAAGEVTLRRLADPALHRGVTTVGEGWLRALGELDSPLIREVRGRGMMVAVELRRPAAPTLRALQRAGVIALPGGSTTIRFLPPVIATAADVAIVVDRLARCLADAAVALS